MVKLWRCEICGDPYVGKKAPANCPFCGAYKKYIKKIEKAQVNFNVKLNEKDKSNVEKALQVELSNTAFYDCASKKTDNEEGKQLFKALKKVEEEHAEIWKKILKLGKLNEVKAVCNPSNEKNLQESHNRETSAITFYKQAALEAENQKVKEIFIALIEVEEDHLKLSEQRLK